MNRIIEIAHLLGLEIAKSDEIKELEAAKAAFEADAELLHKKYDVAKGGEATLIESPYFTMAIQDITEHKVIDRSMLDSFVVYICLEGKCNISVDGTSESLAQGELVLVPAEACDIEFTGDARLMEVYIK